MIGLTALYLSKLKVKPAEKELHNWADHLELLCIANIDGELSDTDVIDRFSNRLKDLQEGSNDEISEELMLNSDIGAKASNRSRVSDNWEIKMRDCFQILNMRSSLYKEFYPFVVNGQEIILNKKQNQKHKLYIYLLLCSNLNLFSKQDISILTDSFELLSLYAFKKILPNDAIIHLFGKNKSNKTGPFKGSLSLWDKINTLSDLTNESLSPKMEQIDFPSKNKGDGGLDIVAWIPTEDNLSSKIIFLCQCACGDDWKKKQHESSYDNWSGRIDFTNYPLNNIFIPYCYRQANGNWHKPSEINKTFLIDRKRILEYCCKNKVMNYKNLPAYTLVDQIFKIRESIF